MHGFESISQLRELVLEPLEHIRSNWDLYWDDSELKYIEEENSSAKELNELILEISSVEPPGNYHRHEDKVANNFSQNSWANIEKKERLCPKIIYKLFTIAPAFAIKEARSFLAHCRLALASIHILFG